MRILLIDDDKLVLYTLQRVLRGQGHAVRAASDGSVGMQLLRSEPADLVITDIVMPEQEGLETIRQIRRDFPHTKIIAISGGLRQGALDVLSMATSFGADDIIAKPFGPHEVLSRIALLTAEHYDTGANADEDSGHR